VPCQLLLEPSCSPVVPQRPGQVSSGHVRVQLCRSSVAAPPSQLCGASPPASAQEASAKGSMASTPVKAAKAAASPGGTAMALSEEAAIVLKGGTFDARKWVWRPKRTGDSDWDDQADRVFRAKVRILDALKDGDPQLTFNTLSFIEDTVMGIKARVAVNARDAETWHSTYVTVGRLPKYWRGQWVPGSARLAVTDATKGFWRRGRCPTSLPGRVGLNAFLSRGWDFGAGLRRSPPLLGRPLGQSIALRCCGTSAQSLGGPSRP
jgi:hypothetical protein